MKTIFKFDEHTNKWKEYIVIKKSNKNIFNSLR